MTLIAGGIAAYGLMIGGLYLFQDKLIFPRAAAKNPQHQLPDGTEPIELHADSNQIIRGNLMRASGESRALVIAFTGNAWNAGDCFTFVAKRLPDVDIAVFHYRGYEPSEGEPGQTALFADALLIHDEMTARLKPEKVVTIGFSLGSGVAAYLASKRAISGQILVTPFDSIEAVAMGRYKIAPVGLLLKHPFQSIVHLKSVSIPTAIIAAGNDSVVPRKHTINLVQNLKNVVMFETIPNSTHSGIYDLDIIDGILRDALDAALNNPV